MSNSKTSRCPVPGCKYCSPEDYVPYADHGLTMVSEVGDEGGVALPEDSENWDDKAWLVVVFGFVVLGLLPLAIAFMHWMINR